MVRFVCLCVCACVRVCACVSVCVRSTMCALSLRHLMVTHYADGRCLENKDCQCAKEHERVPYTRNGLLLAGEGAHVTAVVEVNETII